MLGLSFSRKVQRKVEPYQEEEPADITQKVKDTVTIIPHSRAQIVGAVAFDMMVFDVVVVVRVPCVPVKRVQ